MWGETLETLSEIPIKQENFHATSTYHIDGYRNQSRPIRSFHQKILKLLLGERSLFFLLEGNFGNHFSLGKRLNGCELETQQSSTRKDTAKKQK